MLLSTTYFGPVQWYQKLNRADVVLLERHEHFVKQTYRNRCIIATTQGPQALTVPVERNSETLDLSKTLIHDVRISDHNRWRHLHLQALEAAYGESPFYDYYIDDLRPFFEPNWEYLFDFNLDIIRKMCLLLDIHPNIQFTDSFLPPSEDHSSHSDFRYAIRPKHPVADEDFLPQPYYQVWKPKFGFQPNLSILDLLFNMGPESIFYL